MLFFESNQIVSVVVKRHHPLLVKQFQHFGHFGVTLFVPVVVCAVVFFQYLKSHSE